MSDAVRGLYSMLSDKGLLSYGPGRCFFGPTLDAAIPDPLDLTDMSWLPEIGHSSDLGRTQGITIKPSVSKIELKTADDGERPADKAISAHTWNIELALADAGIVKIAQSVQGIELERYGNGNIKRIMFTDRTYQRDSEVQAAFLFRLYRNGVLSRNPMDNILFFAAAPSTEEAEMAYNSGDQRVLPISFLVYKSLDFAFTDGDGNSVPLHGTSFAWEESESEV